MAIYRAPRPEQHFTTIRNDVARDERLSYRARGVLISILTRSDDWQTTSERLAQEGTEGRDAIRAALTELETVGYLQRVRRQDERGRWSTVAVVYDEPQTPDAALFAPPMTENQASVLQSSVSQALNEETLRNSVPTERAEPKAKGPADVVATAAYDATDKMGNYMSFRVLASKALKAGHTVEAVQAAMLGIIEQGRTPNGTQMSAALRGRLGVSPSGLTDAHTDYWRNGGQFIQEGPTP